MNGFWNPGARMDKIGEALLAEPRRVFEEFEGNCGIMLGFLTTPL